MVRCHTFSGGRNLSPPSILAAGLSARFHARIAVYCVHGSEVITWDPILKEEIDFSWVTVGSGLWVELKKR